MSLILEKCRNGFLMIPAVGQPTFSDAYYLADEQVPQPIKDAFEAEEKEKTLRSQLKSISNDLSLPTLDQEVTERLAA